MAISEFTWKPDREGSNGKHTFAVLKAQFGDGYNQSVADGMNNKVQEWALTFTVSRDIALQITNFLDALQGYKAFAWTPPLGSLSLWTASEYQDVDNGGGQHSISVTFTQEFRP